MIGIGAPLGPNEKGALFDWKDEKLVPVAMSSQLTAPFSSDRGPDGTLYALLDDGTLLRETAAGEMSKVMSPEGGAVVAKLTNDPWVVGKAGAIKPAALKRLDNVGTPLAFGTKGIPRVALEAPSLDAAKAWAKTLSSAGNDAEIVCGAPSSPAAH